MKNKNTMNSRQMPPGAGKAEITLTKVDDLLADGARVTGMLVLRGQDLAGSMRPEIMRQLGPDASPENLQEMAGATIITLAEFNDREEEIYEIPEIREFFRKQNEDWAPWVFAGSVWTPDLFAICLACLPSLIVRRHGEDIEVSWDEKEMHSFFDSCLPAAAMLHSRAGISNEEGYSMLKATAGYLGLPIEE